MIRNLALAICLMLASVPAWASTGHSSTSRSAPRRHDLGGHLVFHSRPQRGGFLVQSNDLRHSECEMPLDGLYFVDIAERLQRPAGGGGLEGNAKQVRASGGNADRPR